MERMNSSSDDEPLHPGGAASDANTAMLKLASGSRTNYMRRYVSFMKWKKAKGVKSFSEEVLLHYFKELATAKLPSSLWAIYSMLKVTLSAKKNIQIAEYSNLTEFLKQQSRGFTSRKSKAFSASEVETFLKKAPDHNYLCVKVALIMVVNGACQFQEMIKLRVSDVQKHSDQLLLVNIMSSPTKVNRTFMILDKDVEIIEKYMALRPKRIKTDRFFIRYYLGKCSRQVIGKNNFQKYPRRIAEYLKLANPELYTGHCFRKTAARLRSNPETESQSRKKLEQSALEHSPGVTVKVEREENKVPFDFIDVQVPPQPSQPPSPRPAARRLRKPRRSIMAKFFIRQIKRDEEREREEHKREMQWLRMEARRIEAEAQCNAVLKGIVDVAMAFIQIPSANGAIAARN